MHGSHVANNVVVGSTVVCQGGWGLGRTGFAGGWSTKVRFYHVLLDMKLNLCVCDIPQIPPTKKFGDYLL